MKDENKTTYSEKEVDELIKKALAEREIKIAELRDKNSSLKAETIRLLKERDEIDKREVEVAKTIEKYEKKNKYLENIIKVRLSLEIEKLNNFRQNLADSGKFDLGELNELDEIIKSISTFSSDVASVENNDSESVSVQELNSEELEERYYKLLSSYEYNKAFLGGKNRGRPKKEDDTIEGFLKEKKKQKEKEKAELVFDIDEALNPTDSLEDIMKDLIDENK